MLQDHYARLPLSSISILRDRRQRTEINTEDLDASIRRNGVIQPIIIRPREASDPPGTNPEAEYILIAGERRYTSCRKNQLPDIPVRFTSDLPPIEALILELEENLKRADLPWRDYVRSVGTIHDLYSRESPDWTQVSTATQLCISAPNLSVILRVHKDLDSPRLAGAAHYRAAYNILSRLDDRRDADIISDIVEAGAELAQGLGREECEEQEELDLGLDLLEPSPEGNVSEPTKPKAPQRIKPAEESILNVDFTSWLETYSGPRFNFLHCDFPYGIEAFNGPMSGRDKWETYHDTPDVYWGLIKTLCSGLDKILAPSAHLMFWFSMEHYHETLETFRNLAPQLEFNPFPLVWVKSDNVGILPDAKRGPRRVYETALIASRGDRPILKPVANAYSAPTNKEHHHSTKPIPVLRHFFQMFVDEHTKLLDPTCGSGSALRAAESMGTEVVLGLERSPEHWKNACEALKKFRVMEGVR